MKIDKMQLMLGVCLAGILSVLAVAIFYDNIRPAPPTPQRIRYLRDSLEMEYYRKAIEDSYPFDHSKIPTHESNP